MSTEQLERRLRAVRLPESEAARERAVKEARAEIASRRAASAPRTIGQRRALGLAAVVLIAGVGLLTPPGRAASAWVGELVGIGDVGGPPSREQPRWREPGTSVVVENGSAPDGTRYEWVAYRCRIDERAEEGGARFHGVGLGLDWPGVKPFEGGGDCEEGAGEQGHGVFRSFGVHILPSQFKGVAKPDLMISGSTGPDVDRVSVIYRRPDGSERELPVDFGRVEGKLRRLASRAEPLGTFIAFLPGEIAARDDVETRLDLRALETTGKLRPGPIARRELAAAREAREACESTRPDNATLVEIIRRPARSPVQMRARQEEFRRAYEPQTSCLESRMPLGPFEYVAYGSDGRVLDRIREPLILAGTLPQEPAGRERPGEARLPYPRGGRDSGRPEVLVTARAPDGALFELYVQRDGPGTCVQLFWPYVFDAGSSGFCGPELPPETAFGRRHPERVAARGFGFLNDVSAATRHGVMTGFARPSVARVEVLYEDERGSPRRAPVTFARIDGRLARHYRIDEPFGVWVTFVPRSAGRRPWLEVVAYAADGRLLGRERQRG